MIGPVSGTGRAMMASLQQQIAKGMPPDQAIAYVKSMAQDGVAPLVDLYAMMNQFQRLKQQQVKPPQNPPTVRDQIMALSQQGMPQQAGIPQAMPQQGAPGMAPPPMEQGLGGMSAGSMENPSFAGGGVVALAEGGDPDDYEAIYGRLKGSKQILGGLLGSGVSAENLNMLRNPEQFSTEEVARLFAMALSKGDLETATPLRYVLKNRGLDDPTLLDIERKTRAGREGVESANEMLAAQQKLNVLRTGKPEVAPSQVAVPPPPPEEKPAPARVIKKPAAAAAPKEMTLEDRIKEQQAPLIQRGFLTKEGKSAATQAYRDILKGEDARMKDYFGKQKSYSLAEAGFKMAQAASRPGATFLGALAEGGMSHSQAMQAMNKEIELNRRQMQQQNYLLDKADEADARGDVDKAIQLRAKHEDQMIDLQKHRDNLLIDREKVAAQRESAAETRDLRVALTGEARQDKLIARMNELRQNDPDRVTLQAQKRKALKSDPEKVPEIEAAIKKRDAELWNEAQGLDLPGMRPEDVTQTSDALRAMSTEDLTKALQARGFNVNLPAR